MLLFVQAARNTRRPMRPKPLIPILIVAIVFLFYRLKIFISRSFSRFGKARQVRPGLRLIREKLPSVIFFTAQKYILYIFYANKKLSFFNKSLAGCFRKGKNTRPRSTTRVPLLGRNPPAPVHYQPLIWPPWRAWPWPTRRRTHSARGCPHGGCRPWCPPTTCGLRGCIQFFRRSPLPNSYHGC